MAQTIVTASIALLLLFSALAHLLLPTATSSWMTRPSAVRAAGAILLILAAINLQWNGWFHRTLAIALGISGAWRLLFPANSIRTQEGLYPRRVHGCLLLAGAIAVWMLRP
jgi:hypothetical protein